MMAAFINVSFWLWRMNPVYNPMKLTVYLVRRNGSFRIALCPDDGGFVILPYSRKIRIKYTMT